MSKYKSAGLLFRMENADTEGAGQDAETSLEVNAEATEAAEEVESVTGDVTEVDTGIENAETAQAELGDVEASVQESIDEGEGLSPREVDHVNARLERIANLLGTTAASENLTLRRESFGSSHSRLTATKMRMEGLKEFGKKIWEALKRGWQWLKDAVLSLFSKLTKNADMLEKRLVDLRGRVATIDGSYKQKESKLKAGAKAFSVNGKTAPATVEQILEGANEIIQSVILMERLTTPKDTEQNPNIEEMSGVLKENLETAFKKSGSVSKLPTGAAKEAKGVGRFVGNRTLVISPDEKVIGKTQHKAVSVSVGDADEKTADDYSAFKTTELTKVADKAVEVAKNLKNFQKHEALVKKSCELNIKFCDDKMKLVANGMKDLDDTKREEVKALYDAESVINQMLSGISRTILGKLPPLAFSAVAAAGDLIEANISNYKKEEKK